LILDHGLFLLFALVAVESAGVPLPGETALIAAGVLASQGHFSLVEVIAVATLGAIVGDNIGYVLGRTGGKALLHKLPIVSDHFDRALPQAERYFGRHGSKTVFIGRFVAILRVTVAWVAGISRMPWWKFFAWNAAGAVVWASVFGTVAYYFGKAAADAISEYGLYAAAVVAVGIVLFGVVWWRRRRRYPSAPGTPEKEEKDGAENRPRV
jgi:membrane protein DedA with SNARE-associated domain